VADPLNLASLFDVDRIMSPRGAPLVATNKTLGSRFFKSYQTRKALHEPNPTVEGRTESPGDRRTCKRWCRRLQPVELRGSSVPPLGAANTPSMPQCRYARLLRNLESHFVGRSRLKSPALCCKGFEWHAFIEMPGGMSPFPTEWVSVGQRVAMHGV